MQVHTGARVPTQGRAAPFCCRSVLEPKRRDWVFIFQKCLLVVQVAEALVFHTGVKSGQAGDGPVLNNMIPGLMQEASSQV